MNQKNNKDVGHMALVHDVENFYYRVLNYKYHDFHENGLDAPKIALMDTLQAFMNNLKEGLYDN